MFTGSILIIASNQTLTQQLIALLRAEGFSQIEYALSTSDARKKVVFFDPDMIIINSPLCGEPGNNFILDISERTTSNLLILTTGEFFLDMQYELQHIGAIIISKPLNRSIFVDTLHFAAHFSRYLGATFDYDTTLHTKEDDKRLITESKRVLIEQLNLSEPCAHRYIQKQSMNLRVSQVHIALKIINYFFP